MLLNRLSSQVVQSGMDAMWMKMQVHTANISNFSTPEYKAKRIDFHEVFEDVSENMSGKMLLRATVTTDEHTEARIDGNNVDMEYEQIELWKAQTQYSALINRINSEYTTLRSVISTMSRG